MIPVSAEGTRLDLLRVDDAHVHPSLAGVVQKGAVEGAADGLVAAEAECEVGHAARDLAARAQALDLAGGCGEERWLQNVTRNGPWESRLTEAQQVTANRTNFYFVK
jgi:hypothetical protein